MPDNGLVQFRLLYSGNQLVSDGDSRQKHIIRKAFHPQLKQLWASHPQLVSLAQNEGSLWAAVGEPDPHAEERAFFAQIGKLYERGGFHFVPLIQQETCLRVSIDILFLRRDQHPMIKAGGDLDNRLKTLFDALRVPDTTAGLGGLPEEDEDPFFVLLQDDCLISEVRVNTDNLLMLPTQRAADAKDAFLVIDVKLKPKQRTTGNWAFE